MKHFIQITCLFALACGGSKTATSTAANGTAQTSPGGTTGESSSREAPPASGPATDVHLPSITSFETANGIKVDVAEMHALPVVYLRYIIPTGSSQDPMDMPGLAHFVAEMMKQGTRVRNAARLAEEIEFLGSDLSIDHSFENVIVSMRTTKANLSESFKLMAEVITVPAFASAELDQLKARERDRLSLKMKDPGFLARREFSARIYGSHPYARIETTLDAINKVTVADLRRWHADNVKGLVSLSRIVVAGDVTTDEMKGYSEGNFRTLQRVVTSGLLGTGPTLPTFDTNKIILIDRPESVQSVIMIGNMALRRTDADYIPLLVANEVLGGGAQSRLFMDLREKRSLTYGAYSSIDTYPEVSPFRAKASVRNQVTKEAMEAFMEHLIKITTDAPSAQEVLDAQRSLADSFPLMLQTPGQIANLIVDLRTFGLPNDYWDTYRSKIRAVTPTDALTAAKKYITPGHFLIVVVGNADQVGDALRPYGNVEVIDMEQRRLRTLPKQ